MRVFVHWAAFQAATRNPQPATCNREGKNIKRNKELNKRYIIFACCLFAASVLTAQVHTSRYFVERAQEYIRSGAWQEAKRNIDEGLAEYPSDPDLRYLNGRYYYVSHNLREARYNLVRATQEDDQHYASKRLLVDVEDDLNHYSSAICYINELLEFQPYDRDLWRRKIGLYRKLGNHVEADAALERLAHIYPNDSIVRREVRNRHRETWNGTLQKNTLAETADNLEQWLDLDPMNLDYYVELINTYERMGEYERALGAANRGLHHFPNNAVLVAKSVGIMSSLGWFSQALSFVKQNGSNERTYAGLLHEVADQARLNDPYEVNGRLYSITKDRDVLSYLINTSLTRGYYDDARLYLAEAFRTDGRTPALLMKQYSLERRCGNEGATVKILEELYHKQPTDEELIGEYTDLMLQLGSRDMEHQQWADAQQHLQRVLELTTPENDAWAAAVSRQITVLGHLGQYAQARALVRQAASADTVWQRRFASAYEDIAANRLRLLIQDEDYEQALFEAQALLDVVPSSEAALRTCINMSQTLRRQQLFHDYAQQGYEAYPSTPYFMIKRALSLHEQKQDFQALDIIRPRAYKDEWVNPQLIAAYSSISGEWALNLMRNHMADLAVEVVDSALVFDPENRELLYTKGLAYERLKDYAPAYDLQHRYYNPSNAEQQEWMEHMRYLSFRSFKNRVDATYTHALYDTQEGTLASTGHLYSIASVAYSRLLRHNTYTAQVSYKGIDGYHSYDDETNTMEGAAGGAGVELMGQWEHQFDHRWSGMVSGAWSNRYFNRFSVNASASLDLSRGWIPSLRIGYRRTPKTYLFLGQKQNMRQGEYNLWLLTPSLEKSWERIKTTLTLDLTAMQSSLYYNAGWKGKLFINDDNISSVSLLAGFGSFPELSFFEQTALRDVSHTNTMVGFDFQYLCTRNLYIGLAGSWNTCFNPVYGPDGSLTDNYRNIYTLSAQLHVAF